jgi:phosphate:Na+ symporter
MVDLTQVVTGLDGISDVATTNLTSVSQQRLTEGIDLSQSRDENTARFADAVFQNLEQAVEIVSHPDAGKVERVIAAKAEIEALAAAARQSMLDKLQLDDSADVQKFRLISEMLEHGKEVARFARMIAKAAHNS